MFNELMPYRITKDGIELQLKVIPKAAQNRIGEVYTDASGVNILRVYVTAVPEDGKANKAVIELLAKRLGIAKSLIQVVRGFTEQRKVLIIANVEVEERLRLVV